MCGLLPSWHSGGVGACAGSKAEPALRNQSGPEAASHGFARVAADARTIGARTQRLPAHVLPQPAHDLATTCKLWENGMHDGRARGTSSDFDVAVVGGGPGGLLDRDPPRAARAPRAGARARRVPALPHRRVAGAVERRGLPGARRRGRRSRAAGFVEKWGASFTSADGAVEKYADFAQAPRDAAPADLPGDARRARRAAARARGARAAPRCVQRRAGARRELRRRPRAACATRSTGARARGARRGDRRRLGTHRLPGAPLRRAALRPVLRNVALHALVRGRAAPPRPPRRRHPHGDAPRPRLVLVHPDLRRR